MTWKQLFAVAGLAAAGAVSSPGDAAARHGGQASPVGKTLEAFAIDYKSDPMALDAEFGVKVGDQWWRVGVKRKQDPVAYSEQYTFHDIGPHEVVLSKGQPKSPTWYFDIADQSVLEEITRGTLTAGTGAMRSFSSDKVMVDVKDMEGFVSDAGDTALSYHTLTHFWAKGVPEIAYFQRDNSLPTHGVGAVALYTMKDKRIAWFSIAKEEAANNDARLESGQAPNLFIFTKGAGKADFGEGEIDVRAGMSVFVGPYVKHVIYNPNDEPLEGVLILFGDNIDFVYGKSYLDLLEAKYEFYGDYPFAPE